MEKINDITLKPVQASAYKKEVNDLLDWYAVHKRPLPWRTDYNPYHVWVSEVMLQQTQMSRGVEYFYKFIHLFPDVHRLAQASLEEVYKAWEGLGYYSRAKNMHKTAQILSFEHKGVFPKIPKDLERLPGIGPYTAGAISSIAFNLSYPLVDANVERIFSRFFDVDIPVKSKPAQEFFWNTAKTLLPEGKARDYNQALMDLGALCCSKRSLCSACPLSFSCQSHYLGISNERPITAKRPDYIHAHIVTGILSHSGKIFIQKRLEKGPWAGLWECPGGKIEEGEKPEDAIVREFKEETGFQIKVREKLGLVQHAYTRYKVSLHCFIVDFVYSETNIIPEPVLEAASAYAWVSWENLEKYALPAGHRKALKEWEHRIKAIL